MVQLKLTFRKWSLLLVAILAISVSACSQTNNKTADNPNDNKVLVAYFSATGTTRVEAQLLAKVVKGTLYEIEPATKYTAADLDWHNNNSRSSIEMNDESSRPAIVKNLSNLNQYSTVYLGSPIWWGTVPRIINTFLDTYDLSGKTVYLFVTSGSSMPDQALRNLKKQYPKVNFVAAKRVNNLSASNLKAWVSNLQNR